jgi:hypothetical protein
MWLNKLKEFFKIIFYSILTLPRDFKLGLIALKAIIPIYLYKRDQVSLAEIFKKWVTKQPNKPCIVFDNEIWTFQDVAYLNLLHLFYYK